MRGYVVLGCGGGKLGWEMEHITFSPDGNSVLTVPSLDAVTHTVVKIWDSYAGAVLVSLEGHKKFVPMACFSPCGKYVALVARGRQSVGPWRTSDGSCVMTLPEHECPVHQIAFSPDGKTLLSGMEDGTVHFDRMHDIVITAKGREWVP